MLIALVLLAATAHRYDASAVRPPQVAPRMAATAGGVSASRETDSVRILRAARRAQETFELVRRRYLPREFNLGSHHCDVNVGRWCVWNDETNDRQPPPESPRIREARERLLGVLDSLRALRPGDEWIASQQVRYLIEAERYGDAVRVAERCVSSAVASFHCRALSALALHDSGAVASADSAFRGALAAMPADTRCKWTDLSLLLDSDLERRYAKLDCEARDAMAETYWRLGAPLFLFEPDWRNEYLARVTRSEMAKSSLSPMGSPNDDAYRETALRYGFDTWYIVEQPAAGSMRESTIAGYRAQGAGYNFVPAPRAFASPADLRTEDWALKLRTARAMYAPTYVRHFRTLDRHQLAVFRRADTALVVAAYDVSADTLLARGSLTGGAFCALVDSVRIAPPIGSADTTASVRGTFTTRVPWQPMVVSIELFNRGTKSAARARYGVRMPSSEGRIAVSDLLLYAPPRDSTQRRLADVIPLALTTDRVRAREPLGLFWETYGLRPEGEVLAVSITIERIGDPWFRKAAERLHLASRTYPLRVQWQEVPDRGDGVASRAVSLDLSRLAAGRYRIRLSSTPRGEAPVLATREVVVER